MNVKQLLVPVLLLGCGCGGATGSAAAGQSAEAAASMLRWNADAGSVEAQIGAHLVSKELVVQHEEDNGQELLVLAYEGQQVPDFVVLVRANAKPRSIGDQDPRQYLVVVVLRTRTGVPPERTAAVLEGLNVFNGEWAYGAFYLDQNADELVGIWPIRIDEGEPFALDTIYDAIVSLVQNWYQLYPVLIPAKQDAPPTLEDDSPLPKGAGPITRATRTR